MIEYITVFSERYRDLLTALGEHIYISGLSVLFGSLLAIPLGIYLTRMRTNWVKGTIFTIANVFQTIPSLALLAMLIPLLGVGLAPAIFALFLYSLMPLLRNTYAGFQSIDPDIIESAKGMGYSPFQRLTRIELPLAFSYIMSGLRVTTVYIISWTTLATLIGAGGLGQLIVGGLGVNDKQLIFAAAVASMLLALFVDIALNRVERFVSQKTHTETNA
ncbi:ABC transporter permease [Bacillus fonticola]|uniref:ABC transporter permease n=1 Tax=Bacillus fonticola TaxID=2728853 RepID=UPI001473DB79|nr:ABC transporter permease [Bacillus fonticola]